MSLDSIAARAPAMERCGPSHRTRGGQRLSDQRSPVRQNQEIAIKGNFTGQLVALAVFALTAQSWAYTQEPKAPASSAEAAALVQRAVDRSLAQAKTHRPVRFELRKMDDKRDTTKEIVETKDGDVARLIAVDGKPLSADAEQAERARLDDLLAHPELEQKRQRDEQRDAARVDRLMKLLPQAFLYTLEGTVPCANGGPGGTCYRLSFTPNPDWNPPDMESSLFKSLAGEVWIDQGQGWMARLDAHFIQNADLGMGLLAKVNKGGNAYFEQTDVGTAAGMGHDWEITAVRLDLNGRVVMFKALSLKMRQEMSHFAPVPAGIGYRDAVKLLEQPAP